jgi:hypothetical protein
MLETGLKHWLTSQEEPGDFYQLVGLPKLCRDQARLLAALEEASESLFAFQHHKDKSTSDRARALQRQVAEARRIVADPARWQMYDQEVIDRLRALCRVNPRFIGPNGKPDDLRRWLALVQQVDPARIDELVQFLLRESVGNPASKPLSESEILSSEAQPTELDPTENAPDSRKLRSMTFPPEKHPPPPPKKASPPLSTARASSVPSPPANSKATNPPLIAIPSHSVDAAKVPSDNKKHAKKKLKGKPGRGDEPRLRQLPIAKERGDFSEADSRSYDSVDCTVFAPPKVRPDSAIVVQVFAHRIDADEDAKRLAEEIDESAKRRGKLSLGTRLTRGAKLSFELCIPEFQIENSRQTLTWRGRTDSVSFGVRIPKDVAAQSVLATLHVFQESVPIGTICFTFALDRVGVSEAGPLGESRRFQNAFVSYARADIAEVLRRVQMLPAVGIRIFQDVFDLVPGERWEFKLYQRILESDVLLLFWSRAAKTSEWVEKEWRYALDNKGDGSILPVVIEGPPIPDPPTELAHLHFGDPMMYFLKPARFPWLLWPFAFVSRLFRGQIK